MRLGGPTRGIVIKTVHKNLPGVEGIQGDWWVGGCLFDMKLTFSVRHNCLKLKMIIESL